MSEQAAPTAEAEAPTVNVDGLEFTQAEDGTVSVTAEAWASIVARLEAPPALGSWLTREPANIYEALARAMVELPGIGKGGTAAPQQGGYAYRGIEQITAEAQGILGRLGVVTIPIIVGDPVIKDIIVSQNPWTETTMRIKYRFIHGPSGTKVTVGGKKGLVAIARDNSDKGANKCMTQAYKYALLQTLMIGDKADDVDAGSPQSDAPAQQAWEFSGYQDQADYDRVHDATAAAWAMLEPDQVMAARDWLRTKDINRKWPLPAGIADELMDRLRVIVAQDNAAAPDPDPDAPAELPRPTVEPGGDEQPASTTARAPSARDLERAGVLPADTDAAVELVQAMSGPQLTAELSARNLAPNGTPNERKRRLAAMIALELAQARPGATVHPIEGEEEPGDDSGPETAEEPSTEESTTEAPIDHDAPVAQGDLLDGTDNPEQES